MKLKRLISHLMIAIAATFGLTAFAATASAGGNGHHGNRGHHAPKPMPAPWPRPANPARP